MADNLSLNDNNIFMRVKRVNQRSKDIVSGYMREYENLLINMNYKIPQLSSSNQRMCNFQNK